MFNNQSDKQEGSHCAYIALEADALMAQVQLISYCYSLLEQ